MNHNDHYHYHSDYYNGSSAVQEHCERKDSGQMVERSKGEEEAGDKKPQSPIACSRICAGVAAAVASLTASLATLPEKSTTQQKAPSKTSSSVASAAALVASHCIEIAEEMGAEQEHILAVVSSAVNARTNGDIMALTAGAATGINPSSPIPVFHY